MSDSISEDERRLVKQKLADLFLPDQSKEATALLYLDSNQHSDHRRNLAEAAEFGSDDLFRFYVLEMVSVMRTFQAQLKSTPYRELGNHSGTYQSVSEWSQHGVEYPKGRLDHPFHALVDSQDRAALVTDTRLTSILPFAFAGYESTKATRPNENNFQVAVIGYQQVGKSALIQQLQRLDRFLPQSTADGSRTLPTGARTKNLVFSELRALGLATNAPAKSSFGQRKTFYEVNNVEGYDLLILVVGNRFREDDEAIIHSASRGKHKQPVLIAKVFNRDPSKPTPQPERDAIEASLMSISAFLNREYYSNVSVFAVNLLTDFSGAAFQLNEQQFLDRIQMHYEQFCKPGQMS